MIERLLLADCRLSRWRRFEGWCRLTLLRYMATDCIAPAHPAARYSVALGVAEAAGSATTAEP